MLTGWESFHQRNNSFREHNTLFLKHMQPSSVYTYNTAHAEHRWLLWYNDRIVSYQQYHVFGRNLTWYFIGVYTINTVELSLTFWILLNFKWRRGVHLLKKNFCKKLFQSNVLLDLLISITCVLLIKNIVYPRIYYAETCWSTCCPKLSSFVFA